MSNYTIKAKNKYYQDIRNINVIDEGDTCKYYDDRYDCIYTQQEFNNLFEVVEERKITLNPDNLRNMKFNIDIQPSERIDYCCECGKEHGYECPVLKAKEEQGFNKIVIEGEEYELFEMPNGTLSTRRDGYVGQYKIIAKKGDEEFIIFTT